MEIPVTGTSASTVLRVSQRQGDNYRVGVSTHRDTLQGVAAVPGSSFGEVKHVTLPDFVQEGTTATKMVTVWRTIRFEFDHLDTAGVYGPRRP